MAQAAVKILTGTIAYREKVALPKNAQVLVVVEDVSIADRAALAVGQTSFSANGKQVPLSFTLSYRSDQVAAGHNYAIRARITLEGKLLFTSTGGSPVRLDGQDLPVNLILQQVIEHPLSPAIEATAWIPYEIKGVPMIHPGLKPLSLKFDSGNHKFDAFAGVNQLGGAYDLSGNKLSFMEIFSTLMAGPSELMEQESRFKKALGKVTKVKVFDDKLVLYAGDKAVIKAKAGQ